VSVNVSDGTNTVTQSFAATCTYTTQVVCS
jgi:hypothetical protein